MLHQARRTGLPLMNLLRFKDMPILEQLHLEEKLLRTSLDNCCIINDGTDSPTIVMGRSGKPAEVIELGPVLRDRVPVIRRPTGGGTVVVDNDTIFVSHMQQGCPSGGATSRDHPDFVCRMNEYLPRMDFYEKTLKALETHFTMKPVNLEAVGANDGKEMTRSSRRLSGQECPLESVAG